MLTQTGALAIHCYHHFVFEMSRAFRNFVNAPIRREYLKVLDITSGEGYGSSLSARSEKTEVWVDICEDAIAHTKNDPILLLVFPNLCLPLYSAT